MLVQGKSFEVGQRFQYLDHPGETYKLIGDRHPHGHAQVVRESNLSRWGFGRISGITNVTNLISIPGPALEPTCDLCGGIGKIWGPTALVGTKQPPCPECTDA